MSCKILRGRVLSFREAPSSHEDETCYTFHEDGCVVIEDGKIVAMGEYADVASQCSDAPEIDHRPHLILPGLIDTHIHASQFPNAG